MEDGDDENEDEESSEQIRHPWRNKVDKTNKTWNRLAKSVNRGFNFWSFNIKVNPHNQSVNK